MAMKKRLAYTLAYLAVASIVLMLTARECRKMIVYKRIIYNYQDIVEYQRDSLYEYIYKEIGEPNEDYYYNYPRYPHFWDARKKR